MAPSPPPVDDEHPPRSPSGHHTASRRRFLRLGGASALGLALGACASDTTSGTGTGTGTSTSTSTTTTAAATATTRGTAGTGSSLTAADFDGLATCILLPELTAGPFPLAEQFDRRDVTEGVEGQPMRLGLRVVDDACTPVPGAAVEIWHCDATGDYSGFTDGGGGKDEGTGTTFLRGTQVADDAGIVEFLSIVPGRYRGRAVHVHLRVHLDDTTVLTSQLFFDPDHLELVYADAPYAELGMPDTSNEQDGIAGDVERNGTLLVTTSADTSKGPGTLALVNLGIDPDATSSTSAAGGPGAGPLGRRT